MVAIECEKIIKVAPDRGKDDEFYKVISTVEAAIR
jgi:hypothetical protein